MFHIGVQSTCGRAMRAPTGAFHNNYTLLILYFIVLIHSNYIPNNNIN
jgi:hypothetical protein